MKEKITRLEKNISTLSSKLPSIAGENIAQSLLFITKNKDLFTSKELKEKANLFIFKGLLAGSIGSVVVFDLIVDLVIIIQNKDSQFVLYNLLKKILYISFFSINVVHSLNSLVIYKRLMILSKNRKN